MFGNVDVPGWNCFFSLNISAEDSGHSLKIEQAHTKAILAIKQHFKVVSLQLLTVESGHSQAAIQLARTPPIRAPTIHNHATLL